MAIRDAGCAFSCRLVVHKSSTSSVAPVGRLGELVHLLGISPGLVSKVAPSHKIPYLPPHDTSPLCNLLKRYDSAWSFFSRFSVGLVFIDQPDIFFLFDEFKLIREADNEG